MQIKDATRRQVWDHIAGCDTCKGDTVMDLRLDLYYAAERGGSERAFQATAVTERVGDLHGQFI
jgi:hypothetical protein